VIRCCEFSPIELLFMYSEQLFFKITEAKSGSAFFNCASNVLILTERWVGIHFGLFSQNLSGHLDLGTV
jgi:hypothetical protein